MKNQLTFWCSSFILILLIAACTGGGQQGSYQNESGKNPDKTERLEQFLNIPVYPGAEMVMFITDDRNDEIPGQTKPATVSLTVDYRDSVPVFYEKVLNKKFQVDTAGGKTYYKLVFDKGNWEYEIMVGQDTFENKPMYTISIMEPY